MKIPKKALLPSPFFGNYFCIIPNTNMAFVCISKNAGTFLKNVALYNDTGKWLGDVDPHTITHDAIGYDESSKYLVPVEKMKMYENQNGRLTKFAVWRDPIKRVESVFKLFCLERAYLRYFHTVGLYYNTSFEKFMDFLEFEWKKEYADTQDGHIRRQVDYYDATDVDFIVPIKRVYDFLAEHKVPFIREKVNKTQVSFEIKDESYLKKIRDYYEDDWNIICNYS